MQLQLAFSESLFANCSIFRTTSNIYAGIFFRKYLTPKSILNPPATKRVLKMNYDQMKGEVGNTYEPMEELQ